jgi:cation diffusion facilitator family transporter
MSPQRRTALVSVAAACVLITVKLVSGLASGSLGLVAEAVHSGTDLVAALLTFYAVGYAERPADRSHPYGHGKAEHLAALAEAGTLSLVSVGVAGLGVARIVGWAHVDVSAAWWAFAAAGGVLGIDATRMLVSLRAARRYSSAALLANALHFGSDLAGTLAVLLGLAAVRAGWQAGDSLAALFVAALVLVAAARLMRRNVDVLMDRAPADAVEAARRAIEAVRPAIDLRRLRLRQAAGRSFADVVIGVAPGAVVGQGHAVADRVEAAVQRVLPGSDVVVHVEPAGEEAGLRERIQAAAMAVFPVREVHNLVVIETARGAEVSLHLKLPGSLPLEEAHEVAEQVERAVEASVPHVATVHIHLEPLAEESAGREVADDPREVEQIVVDATGDRPRAVRFLRTREGGTVLLLTLGLPDAASLADAHAGASEIEERIRVALPHVSDVIVHTEP